MNRPFDPLNAQNKNVERTKLKLNASDAWNGMEWMDLARASTTETVATDDENTTETRVRTHVRTHAVLLQPAD